MLEGIIRFLPWMATVDSFQHWIYTHPNHDRKARQAEWMRLMQRFSSNLDWTGWEQARQYLWQHKGTFSIAPSTILNTGSRNWAQLAEWDEIRDFDPARALASYRAALALGGTRPLPKLFAAAGIVFDFSPKTLRPLMAAIGEELQHLHDNLAARESIL